VGKHFADKTDSQLEVSLLSRMLSQINGKDKSLVIGLSSFPNSESCRTALDAYTLSTPVAVETSSSSPSGSSAELMLALKAADVDDTDVADYLQILQFARENKLKVIPLGLSRPQSAAGQVGSSYGGRVISDTEGFVSSTRGAGFTRYVELVLKQDFKDSFFAAAATSTSSGSSSKAVSLDDYVGFRLLSEEAIASADADFVCDSHTPAATLIVLTDQRNVKFGYGLQERLIRNINKHRSDSAAVKPAAVLSILLNPTPVVSLIYFASSNGWG
jgi:hypothetical protein